MVKIGLKWVILVSFSYITNKWHLNRQCGDFRYPRCVTFHCVIAGCSVAAWNCPVSCKVDRCWVFCSDSHITTKSMTFKSISPKCLQPSILQIQRQRSLTIRMKWIHFLSVRLQQKMMPNIFRQGITLQGQTLANSVEKYVRQSGEENCTDLTLTPASQHCGTTIKQTKTCSVLFACSFPSWKSGHYPDNGTSLCRWTIPGCRIGSTVGWQLEKKKKKKDNNSLQTLPQL